MKLSIDYDKVSESISKKQVLRGLIISSAILLNLLPLFTKDLLNKNAKLTLASVGLLSALACCKLPEFEYESKLKDTFEKTSIKQHKILLTGEVAKLQTLQEISNQQELAGEIEKLPDYQIDFFAPKYGVAPLISKYFIASESEEKVQQSNYEAIGTPQQPTIYIPELANAQWIDTLVYEFTAPQGKRLHEHLMINGGTQAGKSTLISVILGKIINIYQHQGKQTQINLIDPKYPMTRWLFEPSFTGYENVVQGVKQAIIELDNRKSAAKLAKKSDTTLPQFTPYLCIIDEWDICYGNKKGYADLITKDDAEYLLSSAKRIISEGAAYDIRLVLIGQSPLTMDNGVNRSLAKQTTRIVVGQEGLSWLQDPGFPFKKDASELIDQITPLLKAEKRCALICPNKGAVKVFEIPDMQILMPDEKLPATPEETPQKNAYDQIADWCRECHKQYGKLPTDEHLKVAWKEISGKDLNTDGVSLLKSYLSKLGIGFN